MEFPSKKDTWLYLIFFIVLGACFAPIFAGREYFLLFFTIPLAILFSCSWFSTKYIVYGSYKTEIISPRNKEQFINLVKNKNSNIEIK
ncbi:PH domain-containing protein [Bacillus thuringiensis]|uniref:PH domain-containing protein n=1 Tax=Bacillus thuringiensis TaxID=1428 RepID=UPI003DA1363D|nr:PH domain-containing protein [Bacillus cereus]